MIITYNQQKIMDYLKGMKEFVSPTEIAHSVGGETRSGVQRHSSWSSPICKRLVKLGMLERDHRGWYRPITKPEEK